MQITLLKILFGGHYLVILQINMEIIGYLILIKILLLKILQNEKR